MNPRPQQSTALAIAALGLILTIAGPLIPGGTRLARNSPPYIGHVTQLAGGSQDSRQPEQLPILAGTSAGEIWRYQNGLWQHLPLDLGGHPVTSLAGDPAANPIGTAGGLYNPPPGIHFFERVADLMQTPSDLIIGNDTGIHLLTPEGHRHLNTGINVYLFIRQPRDGQTYLHAGTIGAGVLSTTEEAMGVDWVANNQGLAQDTFVYSFAITEGGKLIAGTQSGLFWQRQPGETWQPLDTQHGNARVLSLYLAPASKEGTQRLWIGADGHLLHADLMESAEDLTLALPATPVRQPEGALPFGISGIRPTPKGVMISAGAVYQWGPVRLSGWYWISISGIALLLIAGWMLPGRTEQITGPE